MYEVLYKREQVDGYSKTWYVLNIAITVLLYTFKLRQEEDHSRKLGT